MGGPNFAFDRPGNTRDVFWAGDCDTGTAKLGNIILTINGNQQTPFNYGCSKSLSWHPTLLPLLPPSTDLIPLAELVGWKEDLKRIINHVSAVDPRAEKF